MASTGHWLAVVLAATVAGSTQAPEATITGVAVDYASRPLRAATVLIKPLGGGAERAVSTDDSGRYRADHLAPGEYQVVGLHGRSTEHVFERVYARGILNLPPMAFVGEWECECTIIMLSDTTGDIQLSHHDSGGGRLLRSWVMVEPGSPAALGPRTACLCGAAPNLLGRLDLLGEFALGRYVVRGAAAGYERWTTSDVVVAANQVTTIDVTWHLIDARGVEASARAELRGGETLARVETFAGTELIAIADNSDGHALVAAIDAHRLDNRQLERRAAGEDLWRILPPNDRVLLAPLVPEPGDDLMESVLSRKAAFVRVIHGDAVPATWMRRAMPMLAVSRVW